MINREDVYDYLKLERICEDIIENNFDNREEAEAWFDCEFRCAFDNVLDEMFDTGGEQ